MHEEIAPTFSVGDNTDAALLRALALNDLPRVVSLYQSGAERYERCGDINAACFLYTHAFVYALQAGDPRAVPLHRILVSYGREE